MDKYKGKAVPPVAHDMASIQWLYCDSALSCAEDCDDCLYHHTNRGAFAEWIGANGLAGIKNRVKKLYESLDTAESIEQVRATGKEIAELEYLIRKSAAAPIYHTLITFEDRGQDWLVWEVDPGGRIIRCEPFQHEVWTRFRVLDLDTLCTDSLVRVERIDRTHGHLTMVLGIGVAEVTRKEVPGE